MGTSGRVAAVPVTTAVSLPTFAAEGGRPAGAMKTGRRTTT